MARSYLMVSLGAVRVFCATNFPQLDLQASGLNWAGSVVGRNLLLSGSCDTKDLFRVMTSPAAPFPFKLCTVGDP